MSWLRDICTGIMVALLEWFERPARTTQVGGGEKVRGAVERDLMDRLRRRMPKEHYGSRAREPRAGDSGRG